MRFRIVTWNVHSCVGTDRRYAPERIADVLRTLEPDVVGLQEVDWRQPRCDGRDQLELIADRLGMTSVAGANLSDHRGEYGNGLLTRLEVREVERIRLAHEGREPRGAIDVMLHKGGFRLRAMVTHLGLKRWERRRQIEALHGAVTEAAAHADGVVLMADLNEWIPPAFVGVVLTPDPFPTCLMGRTFPSWIPCLRLDRILLRPTPTQVRHRVVRSAAARRASDHLPLVADIEWGDPTGHDRNGD